MAIMEDTRSKGTERRLHRLCPPPQQPTAPSGQAAYLVQRARASGEDMHTTAASCSSRSTQVSVPAP